MLQPQSDSELLAPCQEQPRDTLVVLDRMRDKPTLAGQIPPIVGHRSISGSSVTLCVTGDELGNILTSTDPTGGASTWASAPVDIPGCERQPAPCISEQLHARDDRGTRVVDTAPPGHGNSIGNVTLDQDSLILSWTHDGAQRRLQPR